MSRADKEDACFLCTAASGSDDVANYIVRRGETCFALLNRFPYNNGHVLVAPYAHKADLPDLTDAERSEMITLLLEIQAALRAVFRPHGFNIGFNIGAAAGAGVPGHLHAHVVPRWAGDTSFISTLADVKVVSQSLDESCAALRKHFAEAPAGQ